MIDFIIQELILYAYLLIAMILGGILGFQREYTRKPAGLRTYMLVSMGAALFTIISKTGFDEFLVSDLSRFDPTRIASNIVVGIGFLGAGVIIFRDRKVQGLTTAAGLWLAGAIGMAVGAGDVGLAVFATLLGFVVLDLFGKMELGRSKKKL
jgi:putative Mg2+ transporter-C (MgtC) family protein